MPCCGWRHMGSPGPRGRRVNEDRVEAVARCGATMLRATSVATATPSMPGVTWYLSSLGVVRQQPCAQGGTWVGSSPVFGWFQPSRLHEAKREQRSCGAISIAWCYLRFTPLLPFPSITFGCHSFVQDTDVSGGEKGDACLTRPLSCCTYPSLGARFHHCIRRPRTLQAVGPSKSHEVVGRCAAPS